MNTEIIKAAETIKEYCENTKCSECPFFIDGAMFGQACKIGRTVPEYWKVGKEDE